MSEQKQFLMTVAVPCYNSEAYMSHCIDTLIASAEDIEIILVDDGSKDGTGAIADDYAARYPDRVVAIHQENGGHGEGVNQGIRHARGLYYKVVDSDDWVNEEAFARLLSRLRTMRDEGETVDMAVANYVYEHAADNTTLSVRYGNVFPEGRVSTWDECGKFHIQQYLMMHSLYFRTELLRACGLELPKHTFYVDNLYIYVPLPYVEKILYLDEDVYRYYIGREGQSVAEAVITKRIDQQRLVTQLAARAHNLTEIKRTKPKPLYLAMKHELKLLFVITATFTYNTHNKEKYRLFRELLREYKALDPRSYRAIRFGTLLAPCVCYTPIGRFVVVTVYRMLKKVLKYG